jgi:hypothetical protein
MQLLTVLCYTYDKIFVTQFLKSNTNYIQPQGQPPPRQGEVLVAHLVSDTGCAQQRGVIMIVKQLRNNRIKAQNSIHLLKLKKKIKRKGKSAWH